MLSNRMAKSGNEWGHGRRSLVFVFGQYCRRSDQPASQRIVLLIRDVPKSQLSRVPFFPAISSDCRDGTVGRWWLAGGGCKTGGGFYICASSAELDVKRQSNVNYYFRILFFAFKCMEMEKFKYRFSGRGIAGKFILPKDGRPTGAPTLKWRLARNELLY